MSLPYYVSISTAAGDEFSAVTGIATDPAAAVILIDPLTHSWGWESDLIPGRLEPSVTTFTLAATDATLLPDLVEGDTVTVTVSIDDAPALVFNERAVITDARITLDPRPTVKRPARLTVTVTDRLSDAASTMAPQLIVPGRVQQRWRERWANIGYNAGVSIGCPSSWPDIYGPGSSDIELGMRWGDNKSLAQLAAEMCNTWAVGGVHHTLVPHNGLSYPFGWEWVGAVTWSTGITEFTDPISNPRYLLVPASRYVSGTLPPQPTISARYCVIPATARRGREHDINTVAVVGKYLQRSTPRVLDQDGTYNFDRPGSGAQPRRTRSVSTQLATGYYDDNADDGVTPSYPAPDAAVRAGQVFATDPTAAGDRWVFEQLQIKSSALEPADAQAILPLLAPVYPTGPLVRRLTITDIEPRARIAGPTLSGFITRGTLTLAGGRMSHALTLAPGDFTTNPHGA